jgi:hypothetical protein
MQVQPKRKIPMTSDSLRNNSEHRLSRKGNGGKGVGRGSPSLHRESVARRTATPANDAIQSTNDCSALPGRNVKKIIIWVWLTMSILSASGCQPSNTNPADSAAKSPGDLPLISEWTTAWSAKKERAEQWRDAMFNRLLGRLTETLTSAGPIKAIVVCKEDAPAIAEELNRDGVRIGRTSWKLRNPQNQPPSWAAKYVQQQVTEPVFVALESDKLGALLPIRLKDTCLMCHGSQQQIPPDVWTAIRANYPQDQAIDFAANDLRGYFWVEVER